MSFENPAFTLTTEDLMLDDKGQLILWYTNALWHDNDYPDQATMQAWAEKAVQSRQDQEVAVQINLDLPACVRDLLTFDLGEANELNGATVDPKYKDRLTVVKNQLEHALAMFNRITYSEKPVTAAIDPDECHPAVYQHGESLGLFDMTKQVAAEHCRQQTAATGRLHDYHFFGGRAHIKALPESWKEPL